LLHTSILERLSAPLCDALLERTEPGMPEEDGRSSSGSPPQRSSASVLEYLERVNLFLAPLDGEGVWFRYHHLFADLLRTRLHQAQPGIIPRLHIQASTWLESNGLISDAIQHLFAAQEIDRAADLIERYGPAGLTEGDPAVMRLVDSLPPEMLLARLKIGLYQAWFLIIQGHIGKVLPLLQGLKQQLEGADEDAEQIWMQTMVASALAFLAPPGSPPEFTPLPDDPALDEIPAEEPILRNAADFLYGMALARRGDIDHAVEVALRCIQREKLHQGASAIPTMAPFLTRIYLMLGRLHACADLCREFMDPIRERDNRFVYTAGSMQTDLGEVLHEWNCLEDAEKHIRAGLQANEPWRNIMTDAFGLVALAHVLQAKGDYAGALQAAEKLEARLQEQPRPREFNEEFRTLRVRVQLAAGDLEAASLWADEIQRSEDFESREDCYILTLARIRLVQGRYAEVEALLAEKKLRDASGSRIAREIEACLLLAVAAGQQRLPETFRLIETCLSLGEPEGYLRVFLDVGEPARDLLAAYLRTDAPGHATYAKKVLEAFSPASEAGAPKLQQAGLVDPLTGREMEVLRLIALGRTNVDIAHELIVSPGTVKAHTASIYRKLEAANRTEAVARARKLEILP
jgi:LuxR family maltose regulon positive regulatory protein